MQLPVHPRQPLWQIGLRVVPCSPSRARHWKAEVGDNRGEWVRRDWLSMEKGSPVESWKVVSEEWGLFVAKGVEYNNALDGNTKQTSPVTS